MIKRGEITTRIIAVMIERIADMNVMTRADMIKTAIGIGMKTAIAYIATKIVTMTHIPIAMIARTATEGITAAKARGVVAFRRRTRADLTATIRAGLAIVEATTKVRSRAWTDAGGTFTHYGIPNPVPFSQVVSPGICPIVAY
jgi:antitoxin component of RelBE/YafQ-DinJ toxin-antitoxin module